MAKKDKVDFGEIDLDDLDFDALDFGDPFAQPDTKPKGGAREAVTEFVSSSFTTAKNHLLDRGTLRRLLSGGLHKGYTQASNAYDALESGLTDVMSDNASELQPLMMAMKRKTDRLSPMAKRFLPKFLTDAMDDAEYRGQSSNYQGGANDALSMNLAGLDRLFVQQAQGNADQQLRDTMRDNRDQKRFVTEAATQLEIGRGIGRLVGYQDNITINYHRKSLEIGYRQLDVAVRMLQLQQTYFGQSDSLLKDILKNTGLPDFIKMQHVEVLKQQMANKLAGKITNTVGGWASNFFSGMKKNASGIISGVANFKDSIDQTVDPSQSRAQAYGQALGRMGGTLMGQAGEQALHVLVEKLKPALSRIPGLESTGEKLRSGLSQIPQKLNEYAKSETNTDGWFGARAWVEEGLKALIDTYSATGSVSGLPHENLDQAAIFDNLVYKSITEIMPGYLASMDKWLHILATGEDQEEMAYSHYTGGFVSRSTLNQQHVRIALKNNAGKAVRQEVDGLLRDMGAQELSVEAKRALRLKLMKDLAGGNSFKPDRYTTVQAWQDVDEEVANELITFISDQFGIYGSGDARQMSESKRKLFNDVAENYEAVQRRLPDYGGRMDVLQKHTGRRVWRELGLSRYNGISSDVIDRDALHNLIVNEGDDFDPAEIPPTERKALAEYQKRMQKAKDELHRNGVGNNDNIDVNEARSGGKGFARPPKETEKARRERYRRERYEDTKNFVTLPKEINAKVTFPELQQTSDEITHQHLTTVVERLTGNNDLLNAILQATLEGGGGGDGDPSNDGGSPDDTNRRSLARRILGGVGRGIGMTGKGIYNYITGSYRLMGKGISGISRLALGGVRGAFKPINGLGVCDIYVAGQEEPALVAKDIKRGVYVDAESGKVITKIKDIKGPVKDLRTNDIVLTEEDIAAGLYNGEGKSLAGYTTGLALGAAKTVGKGTAWYFGTTYGLMWSAAKKVTEVVVDQFTQYDAYFPGEDEPRISSKKMKRGFYRTREGAPIMSLKEITGAVFDIEGNEVISDEEIVKYKSLYARNGSLLFTFGRGMMNLAGRAGSLALRGAKWYGRMTLKMYKGMFKAAAGIGRGIGRLFGKVGGGGGGGGSMDEELAEMSIQIQGRQLDTQLQMLEIMRRSFDRPNVHGDVDGDGVREWSWQDILRRRKEAKEGKVVTEEGDSPDVVNAIEKLGDRFDKKMEELIETTEEAGETSLLEDAADLANLRDGLGGGGEGEGRRGRRGRKGRGARAGGKPGFFKRNAIKAGRAVSRIPGVGAVARVGWGAATAAAGWAMSSGLVSGALSMAGTALAGIGSLLSAPLVLGAIAVAGIAYLGYKYYNSKKVKQFPLLALRLTQYGVNPANDAQVSAMLRLEGAVANSVKISETGEASMDAASIPMDQISRIFNLTSPERMQRFAAWIQNRFRPVYLAHCGAMKRIRNITRLETADTNIGPGDLAGYLEVVDLPNMKDVYNDVETSPFEDELTANNGDVQFALKVVRAKIDKNATPSKKPETSNVLGAAAAVTAASSLEVSKAASAISGQKIGVLPNGTDDPSAISKGLLIAGGAVAVGGKNLYNGVGETVKSSNALNIPTAVRYKVYGLTELTLDKCMQLQQVENIYWEQVVYSGQQRATFKVDEDELQKKVFGIFKPINSAEEEEIMRWLRHRFVPAFLQYCLSVRRRYNGDARDGWRNISGPVMKEVLEETTRASTDTPWGSNSVWSILNSPWPKYPLETVPGSVKMYIDSLDKGGRSKVLNVTGMEVQQRTAEENSEYQNKLVNIALGNTRANPTGPGVANNNSTMGNMAKIYSGTQVAGGQPGQSPAGYSTGSTVYNGSFGTEVQHPGGGTGGDINSLPDNKGEGLAQMGPIITGAAKMVGFDPAIALSVAGAESGLKPKASSGIAHGLFQFIDDTWQSMLKTYGPRYGISPATSPYDPRANAILGISYLKENHAALSKSLGKKITDLDLYMSHFLGLGGARRFLSASRSDPSFKHVGNGSDRPRKVKKDGGNAVVGENKSIFLKDYKSDNPREYRNVGEVLAEMDRRMNVGRKIAGNPTTAAAVSDAPASSVPAGPTSGAGAAAGGSLLGGDTSATNAAVSNGGMPTLEGNSGGGAGAPVGGAAAVASAAGAAAGTPSSAPNAPTATPTSPSGGSSPAPAPTPSAPTPPPVETPTATRAAAVASNATASETQAVNMESTNNLLNQSLKVHMESRDLLVSIRDILQRGGTGGGGAQQSAPKPQQQQQPFPRTPLNNTRANAET